MFVVQDNSGEISNLHIYDSQLPMGSVTERSQSSIPRIVLQPYGQLTHTNFFNMQEEKEFVISPLDRVNNHLDNLRSETMRKHADKRELLRNFYLEWLHAGGCELVKQERQKAKDLYWNLDELLKALQDKELAK